MLEYTQSKIKSVRSVHMFYKWGLVVGIGDIKKKLPKATQNT